MNLFVDLYFAASEGLDRTAIEEAIESSLASHIAIVGSGIGTTEFNVDLEILDPSARGSVLGSLAKLLSDLGASPDTMIAISDARERLTLTQALQRYV
jgi:hypothetical protein